MGTRGTFKPSNTDLQGSGEGNSQLLVEGSSYLHWICTTEVFIEIITNKFSYFNKRKKRHYDPNAKKYLNLLYKYYDKLNEVYDMVLTKH